MGTYRQFKKSQDWGTNYETFSAWKRNISTHRSESRKYNITSQIEKLFLKITELKQENLELREENKRLADKNEESAYISTDAQSCFYQDVFITDLMNDINIEAVNYKQTLIEQNLKIEKLEKEIQDLNKVISGYRKTVTEFSNNHKAENKIYNLHTFYRAGTTNRSVERENTEMSNDFSEDDDNYKIGFNFPKVSKRLNSTAVVKKFKMIKNPPSRFGHREPEKEKNKVEVQLDMINNCISAIGKWKSLNNLFDLFKQKIKLLLNADVVHIIISDEMLLEVFKSEEKGYLQPHKLDSKTLFRALENRKGINKKTGETGDEDFNNPIFNTFEESYKGIRHKLQLCASIKKVFQGPKTIGIQNKYPMYCIVQVERKRNENRRHFTILEQQILENINNLMTSTITRIQYSYMQNKRVTRVMDMMRTFREITMERNHVKIYNKILNYVPSLLNVEKVGVFFVDPGDQSLIYTITDYETSSEGIPYITEIAKYPASLGLTGKAISTKKTIIYDKDQEQDQGSKDSGNQSTFSGFVGELDNHAGAGFVKQAIYGPLVDGDGNVTGCIQLLNKIGKAQFDQMDLEEFNTVVGVIATTVKNANESFNILNLSMSLLRNISNIHKLFSNDVEKLGELHEVNFVSNVKIIKQYLQNLIDEKK